MTSQPSGRGCCSHQTLQLPLGLWSQCHAQNRGCIIRNYTQKRWCHFCTAMLIYVISYAHFTFFSVTLHWTHRVQLRKSVLFGIFFFGLFFNCCFLFSSARIYWLWVVKLYVTTFEMCNLSRMICWCTIFLCMTVKNCQLSCWQTEYQTQLSPVCMKEFKKVIDTLGLYLPKKEIMTFSKKIRI